MKSFLLKILFFGIVILLINVILRWFVPYSWGNPGFEIKRTYLKENSYKYNTVFLGSSKTYRQIIPKYFDEYLEEFDISSFNMGYAGTLNPECFFLTEK